MLSSYLILLSDLISSLTHTVIKFPTKYLHIGYLNVFEHYSEIEIVMIIECFLTYLSP